MKNFSQILLLSIIASLLIFGSYLGYQRVIKINNQNEFIEKLAKIDVGMSIKNVEDIIGQPDIISPIDAPLASFVYKYRIPESLKGIFEMAIDSSLQVVDITNTVRR